MYIVTFLVCFFHAINLSETVYYKRQFKRRRRSMKKICSLWIVLLAAWPLSAENNIRMVTYFPVPYPSYADLAGNGQM